MRRRFCGANRHRRSALAMAGNAEEADVADDAEAAEDAGAADEADRGVAEAKARARAVPLLGSPHQPDRSIPPTRGRTRLLPPQRLRRMQQVPWRPPRLGFLWRLRWRQ